jgi:hypothetical protein
MEMTVCTQSYIADNMESFVVKAKKKGQEVLLKVKADCLLTVIIPTLKRIDPRVACHTVWQCRF